MIFLVVLVALLMVGSALLARRGSRLAAEILVATSGLSLLVNKPVEVAILWTVSPGHGLTLADLVGFAGAAYGALMMRRLGTTGSPTARRATIDDLLIDVRTPDDDVCEATPDGRPRFLQGRRRGSAA